MKTVNRWLLTVALAIVVAGSVVQAKAALSGTLWTDEAGFLSRMVAGSFWINASPTFVSGQTYTDPGSTDYGYKVISQKGSVKLEFNPDPSLGLPTGVGGFFTEGAKLTFEFKNGQGVLSTTTLIIGSTGFGGYTTDVDPNVLAINSLTFYPAASSPTKLYVGLDVVPVPEPSAVLAGCLLLLPFAASTIRRIRKSR
jgi:hypothetical protein